jgi:poly-beta-1,6 N-acetyl-D-glucosamine synthase
MMARLYRVFFVVSCVAAGLGLITLVYFNFSFNRLAATNLFVDISVFVLLSFLLILVIRYAFLIWFAYLQHVEHMDEPFESHEYPMISVLVPAFNEGKVIEASVTPLLSMEYPRFEVVVIDDGSTDDTYERALQLSRMYGGGKVRVITQPNGGKATALNTGIANSRGELVLCMDGDSRLETQTLMQAAKHFADPTVGAVAGNVKVANRLNLLTKMQALEYIEGLSLVRTAHAFFRRVAVIPGPIGVFRRSVLEQIGGYLKDTYAEDCELTMRILMAGWKVKYESRAVAWTEAPETVAALFKQRYRWSRGILQAVVKHKKMLLKPLPDVLDWIFLWMLVFESMIWPGMNLFAILFFVFVAVSAGLSNIIVLWWAQLTVLDIVAALFCVALEKEDIRLALYSALYRLWFIPLVDVIKFFASLDEMFGVGMGWGKLERFGRI